MLIIYAYSRKTKFVGHFQESWTYHIAVQQCFIRAKKDIFFALRFCVNLPTFQHKLHDVLINFSQYDSYRRNQQYFVSYKQLFWNLSKNNFMIIDKQAYVFLPYIFITGIITVETHTRGIADLQQL